MNKRLRLAVRNAACTGCRLHQHADGLMRCVTGSGPNDAEIMVITKSPLDDNSRMKDELVTYLREAGIDPNQVMFTAAFKCQTWDIDGSKTDLKACVPYLRAELEFIQPKFVLALGAEAWFAASGWADITKNRGKLFDTPGVPDSVLMPTISPSAVARNPGMRGGLVADLRYFARLIRGEDTEQPAYHTPGDAVTVVDTLASLKSLLRALRAATVVSYDVETANGSEHDPDFVIV